MCALWLTSGEVFLGKRRRGGEGEDSRGRGSGVLGSLLEGSADGSTLEGLGRAVVVHHAALGFALGGEEQAAEFGHL